MQKKGFINIAILVVVISFIIGYIFPVTEQSLQERIMIQHSWVDNDGWEAFDERDFEKAARIFDSYIDENPTNYFAHMGAGWSYYLIGDPSKSRSYFETAIVIVPNSASAYFGLGWVALQENHLDESIAHFQQALAIGIDQHDSDEVLYGLGYAYLRNGDYSDAIRYFRYAQAENPDDVYPHIGLVAAYYANGDFDLAEQAATSLQSFSNKDKDTRDFPKFEECMRSGSFNSENIYGCSQEIFILK